MNSPEDKERARLREEQLQAKERELRLRELELEIHHEQKIKEREAADIKPPLYKTTKHNPPQNAVQKIGRKTVKFVKFIGFVVIGIAVIRAGLFVGIWITYLIMAGIIAGIGYQLFLKGDN